MSIEWHEAIAGEDTYCDLCCRLIPEHSTCCENTTDFGEPHQWHAECFARAKRWNDEQWEHHAYGSMDLNAIDWPQYDEQGKVTAEADPPCVSCGRPRSEGCEDPTACGIAAVPFSLDCDVTEDLNDYYVSVQDVWKLIPSDRWPDLYHLYTLEVGDCDQCGGQGKYQRSNTPCVSCGGTGKQVIAGGVGQ